MDDQTIRVQVPREFLLNAGWGKADPQLIPRLGLAFPLTLGDFALGDWIVVNVEIGMARLDSEPMRSVTPQYWVTLCRADR